MKYYVIAGEASGDLHAANLIKAIAKQDSQAEFRAWGGDRLQEAGAEVVKHYRDLAFMGFAEVVANLRTILRNLDQCKQDILKTKPDALVLVDYPGFNLRIAKWAKTQGIKVIYYISPQIWAWKQNRVHAIKRDVDLMLCILPFEPEFYHRFGMETQFVGHPLLDEVAGFSAQQIPSLEGLQKPVVALLPGSRKQEIKRMLPLMAQVAKRFPAFHFVVAGAPGQEPAYYNQFLTESNLEVVHGQTYNLLATSTAALVASGTATLETALFNVPQVVCYRGGTISYWIARQVVKVKYISLVNLIMDAPVVKELIQGDFNVKMVSAELEGLIAGERRNQLLRDYSQLRQILGGAGASERAAGLIQQFLSS